MCVYIFSVTVRVWTNRSSFCLLCTHSALVSSSRTNGMSSYQNKNYVYRILCSYQCHGIKRHWCRHCVFTAYASVCMCLIHYSHGQLINWINWFLSVSCCRTAHNHNHFNQIKHLYLCVCNSNHIQLGKLYSVSTQRNKLVCVLKLKETFV